MNCSPNNNSFNDLSMIFSNFLALSIRKKIINADDLIKIFKPSSEYKDASKLKQLIKTVLITFARIEKLSDEFISKLTECYNNELIRLNIISTRYQVVDINTKLEEFVEELKGKSKPPEEQSKRRVTVSDSTESQATLILARSTNQSEIDATSGPLFSRMWRKIVGEKLHAN